MCLVVAVQDEDLDLPSNVLNVVMLALPLCFLSFGLTSRQGAMYTILKSILGQESLPLIKAL